METCIFDKEIYQQDGDKCGGEITKHHLLYKSEGGDNRPSNIIYVCRHHQDWMHSKNIWGDEDFDELIPKKNDHRTRKRKKTN